MTAFYHFILKDKDMYKNGGMFLNLLQFVPQFHTFYTYWILWILREKKANSILKDSDSVPTKSDQRPLIIFSFFVGSHASLYCSYIRQNVEPAKAVREPTLGYRPYRTAETAVILTIRKTQLVQRTRTGHAHVFFAFALGSCANASVAIPPA